MLNSNCEVVQPDDGRKETRYFLLMVIALITIAAIALKLIHHQTPPVVAELPRPLLAYATQLSNRVEELNMLEENGLLTSPYSLDEMELPSLLSDDFSQVDATCFVLHHDGKLFAIDKHDAHWQAHWASTTQSHHCDASITWHLLNR